MGSIDLDRARAARREGKGEPPTVTFGGETFNLPVELPFQVAVSLNEVTTATDAKDNAAANAALLDAVRAMFGDRFEAFMAKGPSGDDLTELMNGLAEQYGVTEGEPQASAAS